MALSLSKRQYFTYFVFILLAGLVFGSVSLLYPFGRDQGIYAYAGQLLLEGKIDYKHVFDVKPPGVHFVFALSQLLFGSSMISARIFDIIWQSFAAFVIFLITLRITSSKQGAVLSAFIYLFYYYRLDYWHTLQADGFLNLPMALSVLLLISIETNKRNIWLLLSGFFFGAVILFKYTMIVFLPAVLLILFFERKNTGGRKIKDMLTYIGGFILINIAALLLYLFTGALSEFLDVQVVQTPFYAKIGYETESVNFIIANVVRLFFGSAYSPLILLSAAAFVFLYIRKQLNRDNVLIFSWALASVIGLIIQWKFFYYHFLVIIPAIAIGSITFLSRFREYFDEKNRPVLGKSVYLILIAIAVFAFKPYEDNYSDLFSYASGQNTLKEMYVKKGFTSDSAFMIGKTFNAVDYVKNNTGENDYIYVWGFDPLIYYLSGRHCVSRFIYDFPLYWKGGNRKFREEFMNNLNENNPKMILISQRDPLFYISGYEGDSKFMLKKFPQFSEFIDTKYSFQTQIDNFFFYRLNDRQ